VTFDLDAAMAGARLPYAWNPDHGARVGLLPREGDADAVEWFEVDLCFVYHPLNAFEDADGRIVIDVVRHPKMFDRDRLGPNEGATRLDRWTLDPATGVAKEETLDDTYVELPRVDDRLVGRPHRYGYAMSFDGPLHHGSAVKYDLRTGVTTQRSYGPDTFTDELVFVPRSPDAAEDDGWLLSYVYDRARDASDLVVLAADDFTGDPVATVHLPQRVPFGFHGNWMPAT
jgi:carotenoid cleavage dioxygenase